MSVKEKIVWLRAIRLDLANMRKALDEIRRQLGVIDQALTEINEYTKHLESA